MMPRKLDKTPEKQTYEQLQFYQDLRKGKKGQFATTKSVKQFDVIPYKDKHQYPAFIKKVSSSPILVIYPESASQAQWSGKCFWRGS